MSYDVDGAYARMQGYMARKMYRIRGYMGQVDASLMADLMVHQRKNDYGGNIFEIGVYFGRSYYLVSQSLADGERAFAADKFEMFGETPGGHLVQLEKFKENAQIADLDIDEDDIVVRDSLSSDPYALKARCGKIRFFSIDGGHALEHVVADAKVADHVLADYGVIAFDDFFHPGYPEVTVGVFDFLKEHEGKYEIFAITGRKAYVCRTEFADEYRSMVERSNTVKRFSLENVTWLGSTYLFVKNSMKDRGIEKLMEAAHRAARGFDKTVKLSGTVSENGGRRRTDPLGNEA